MRGPESVSLNAQSDRWAAIHSARVQRRRAARSFLDLDSCRQTWCDPDALLFDGMKSIADAQNRTECGVLGAR